MIQVLHGTTSLEHGARLGGGRFTGAAYCLARSSLALAVFEIVLRDLVAALAPDVEAEGLWRGHRTFPTDGSGTSTPDVPELQDRFGQSGAQRPGCGFPTPKILASFHAGTGMPLKVLVAPLRSHEMAGVGGGHPALRAGDVLVGDRGFCSFAHIAMLTRDGVQAVFRIHQRRIVDFTANRPHAQAGAKKAAKGLPRSRRLRDLGVLDQVVEWFKPKDRPEWMTKAEYETLSETLTVRELRYDVGRPGFRTRRVALVTTLVDAEAYPLEALAELYGTRWRVGLNMRHLKTTMKMDVLTCKTADGVLKGMTAHAIVYNLVRVVMVEAARRQVVDVERISFIDALRWLTEADPEDEPPKLVVNPDRPGRYAPRVRKRRPEQDPLMTKPRSELRKGLLEQAVRAISF